MDLVNARHLTGHLARIPIDPPPLLQVCEPAPSRSPAPWLETASSTPGAFSTRAEWRHVDRGDGLIGHPLAACGRMALVPVDLGA
jgi:hypothetical protein